MTERNFEAFAALGMIVFQERAIAIGAIAQVQSHPSGAATITFVSGKDLSLTENEADDFFKQANSIVMQMRYAAAQDQQGTRRILMH